MSEEMKNCPYCGSEIPKDVKKCKFCGEWLVLQEKDKPKSSLHIGGFIEAIICIILIVCMFKIGYNDYVIAIILSIYIILHIYFLPSLIADKKRTQYTIAIFALNLLLGATIIVWVGCLVWALTLPDLSKNEIKTKNKGKENNEEDDDKNFFELVKEQTKNPRIVIGWIIFLAVLFLIGIAIVLFTDDTSSNDIPKNVYDEYSKIEPKTGTYKLDNNVGANKTENKPTIKLQNTVKKVETKSSNKQTTVKQAPKVVTQQAQNQEDNEIDDFMY